ncbi:hypothetical protein V7127_11640, partial [Bacillus sp. JJ1773]
YRTICPISKYEGWLYLASVMDLYFRKIVGWSMDRAMNWRSIRHMLVSILDSDLHLGYPPIQFAISIPYSIFIENYEICYIYLHLNKKNRAKPPGPFLRGCAHLCLDFFLEIHEYFSGIPMLLWL